ncbi:MAG: O-antigen ligase family protein, partial [Caldilineaceae bacterium]|nr:O-antigen ligase family protein [Caldilineaceae bacterium]
WDLVLMPLLGFGLIRLFLSAQSFAIPNRPCRALTIVATALFVGGVAVGAIGLLGWLRGDGTTADGLLRLVGPYYSPNQAAFYLARSLFLGLGLRHLLPRRRLVMGAALALISTALLLTASRGALLLGLPAGLLLWYGGGYRRQRRLRFVWVTVALRRFPFFGNDKGGPNRSSGVILKMWYAPVALRRVPFFGNDKGGPNRPSGVIPKMWYAPVALSAVVLLLGWLLLGERLTNSATLLHRLTIWQSSWTLWLDYLWFGVGPGGFFWRYPAYLPLGMLDEPNLYHPHNLWLEFATGWGLAGLLWLLLLLWYLVRQLRRLTVRHDHSMRKPTDWLTLSLLAALAAGLAHAQVDAFLVLPDLALWLWFALGLLGSLPHDSDRQPTHSIRPAQNP